MNNMMDLEKQLHAIEDELNSLAQAKYDLQNKIKSEIEEIQKSEIFSWNVTNDKNIVMFKKDNYNSIPIITMNSVSIDFSKMMWDCINGDYTCDYSNDSAQYIVSCKQLSFYELIQLKNRYNIYFFDNVQFEIIQQALCQLKVDVHNVDYYEGIFSPCADNKLSW